MVAAPASPSQMVVVPASPSQMVAVIRSGAPASSVATKSNRFRAFLGTSVTSSRLVGNFHFIFLFYKTGRGRFLDGSFFLPVLELSKLSSSVGLRRWRGIGSGTQRGCRIPFGALAFLIFVFLPKFITALCLLN
ncbi:hypothetical protein AXF42_Ash015762 [Apostasia shenzhenica]|uniref:Uncharacterized protein n=1 Tax=Apostasia shenzhenica TaxID=1088818 RepID=A0A2H9ZUA6_9ASPA|nr:hypothetical protein AXF42_Ash015762 [Apostasia shenzhenica]